MHADQVAWLLVRWLNAASGPDQCREILRSALSQTELPVIDLGRRPRSCRPRA